MMDWMFAVSFGVGVATLIALFVMLCMLMGAGEYSRSLATRLEQSEQGKADLKIQLKAANASRDAATARAEKMSAEVERLRTRGSR